MIVINRILKFSILLIVLPAVLACLWAYDTDAQDNFFHAFLTGCLLFYPGIGMVILPLHFYAKKEDLVSFNKLLGLGLATGALAGAFYGFAYYWLILSGESLVTDILMSLFTGICGALIGSAFGVPFAGTYWSIVVAPETKPKIYTAVFWMSLITYILYL